MELQLTKSDNLTADDAQSDAHSWTRNAVDDMLNFTRKNAVGLTVTAAAMGVAGIAAGLEKTAAGAVENKVNQTLEIEGALYHGTSKNFQQLVPMPNWRGTPDKIVWQGDGVFATPDRRIAMIYTDKRVREAGQGVNLIDKVERDKPVTLYLHGGTSQEDALDKVYGPRESSNGFIHVLSKTGFSHEQGLGAMEEVSRTTPTYILSKQFPSGIQTVNPRLEIENYVNKGEMTISWRAK